MCIFRNLEALNKQTLDLKFFLFKFEASFPFRIEKEEGKTIEIKFVLRFLLIVVVGTIFNLTTFLRSIHKCVTTI